MARTAALAPDAQIEVNDTVRLGNGKQKWIVTGLNPDRGTADLYWSRSTSRTTAHSIQQTVKTERLTLLRKGNADQDRDRRVCTDFGWHGTDQCYCGMA